MKKYLMFAAAALAFASCSKMDGVTTQSEITKAKYDYAFKNYIGGEPAPDQTWGFSDDAYTRSGADITRSASNPSVAEIDKPYDEAWVTEYNKTAKEPTTASANFNSATLWYPKNNSRLQTLMNNYDYGVGQNGVTQEDKDWYTDNIRPLVKYYWDKGVYYMPATDDSENAMLALQRLTNYKGLDYWGVESDWVTEFKITGTWNGGISVAGSEGSSYPGAERTIVVTGTWNINDGEGQRIGSLGKIIIANGGTVNVASGKKLSMVNQARLVVLPGGRLTGDGMVEVSNGNAAGSENYNGGTIDVAIFNNNFGKFYNYGEFLVNEYQGGAQESNFYNHSLAAIDHFGGSTANARIFNACQFYVRRDARIRNYEGIAGSALIVDGELMFSSSMDGTSTPTYVGLAAGALVQCGSLYNNGTSWNGPTSNGYAVLSTGSITYLNWEQDHPELGGYFANNIYVQADTWSNTPDGNGMEGETADKKFAKVQNKAGNGNVTVVEKGTYEVIPADGDFVKGSKGCTPGFKKNNDDPTPPTPPTPSVDPNTIRIIAEDLSAEGASDFDFNDVVLDVTYGNPAKVVLTHAGGVLPLCIRVNGVADESLEVHKLFGQWVGDENETISVNTPTQKMINTGIGKAVAPVDITNILNVNINSAAEANQKLQLWVFKEGSWQQMEAPQGEPACKLAVDESYAVLPERTSIKGRYPLFVTWATTTGFKSKWWTNE